MRAALILFAHGSRDAQWAAPLRALRGRIAEARPDLPIELAFLELMEPSLPAAVERLAAAGCARVIVAPLFIAQGAHVRRDLAALIAAARERHPAIGFELLPALGEVDAVLEAMTGWLVAATTRSGSTDRVAQ